MTWAGVSLANPGDGFTTICTLDESCAVEDSTLVGFGADGDYTYRTLSGAFVCTSSTFNAGETVNNATCIAFSANDTLNGTAAELESSNGIQEGLYAVVSHFSGKALEVAGAAQKDGAQVVQNNFLQEPHQLWYITPLDDNYYSLSALHSDKVLEVRDWSITDGAKLEQTPWLNSWNQHWRIELTGHGYYKIQSRYTGKVLDVFEMNRNPGGDICTWTYWGGENQHWRLVPIELTPTEPSAGHVEPTLDTDQNIDFADGDGTEDGDSTGDSTEEDAAAP